MKFSICPLLVETVEKLQCDSISIYLFEDVVPLRGLAGVIDWRLNGMISRLLIDRTITGTASENFLIPMRPRLRAPKLFGFGLGRSERFDIHRAEEAIRRGLQVLGRAAVHSTALMLPGRGENLYSLADGLHFMKGVLKQGFDLDELILADRFENPEKDLGAVMAGLGLG